MTLGDKETLELNDLCGAVVDGTLTDSQRARLAKWLRESEAARRHYVRALGQSASLHNYAAEMHADAPEAPVRLQKVFKFSFWWMGVLPAAAALALGLFFAMRNRPVESAGEYTSVTLPSQFVARLTAAKDLQWVGSALAPGAHLRKGQRLELARGYAEVTFDSGARIVLEGGASIEINSAWDATLQRGTLKASVPPQAIGFRISNPAVEVVDLGTEFTMIADAHGAEVLVLKGEVEAAPRAAAEQETILLRERESRRFAASGVSDVSDRDLKFARFTQPLELDRLMPSTRFVHWSFDEKAGEAFAADTPGPDFASFAGRVVAQDPTAAHAEGLRGGALRLDGELHMEGSLPGISSNTPHTVAFWVRVPEDASLSESYSMVTWATRNKKLRNRWVGINWNKGPTDGVIGALRTDFGGGQALGTTSLRDGKWHYITVCFTPGDEDPEIPVQVKQYVDGRLESSTIIPGRTRGPAVPENSNFTDKIFVGARLGPVGVMPQRFRGEIDELFVADRGLEPNEIVALMKSNRLPSGTMLATTTRQE
jgi:ferric-dicitrate binding protein FerR (iron transport regulator)